MSPNSPYEKPVKLKPKENSFADGIVPVPQNSSDQGSISLKLQCYCNNAYVKNLETVLEVKTTIFEIKY